MTSFAVDRSTAFSFVTIIIHTRNTYNLIHHTTAMSLKTRVAVPPCWHVNQSINCHSYVTEPDVRFTLMPSACLYLPSFLCLFFIFELVHYYYYYHYYYHTVTCVDKIKCMRDVELKHFVRGVLVGVSSACVLC